MQQLSLLIVMLAALIIPIIMARFKVSSIPTAIAEIITGIILGKSFLNIVNPNWTLNMMSSMGVIMLMFLSGMEINFDLFRKTPGKSVIVSHQSLWPRKHLALLSPLRWLLQS